MTILMVLELEITICATILQPSVTKNNNSDQTRDPDFYPAIQFWPNKSSYNLQEVSWLFATFCQREHGMSLHWNFKSLSSLSVRERFAIYQISWETPILLRPAACTPAGVYFLHAFGFCLDLDYIHVGLNHGECREGFRVCGPEILVAQKCFKRLFNHPTTIYLCYQFHIYKNDAESSVIFIKSNKDLQKSELSSVLAVITVNAFLYHHHSSQNYPHTHDTCCIILIQIVRVLWYTLIELLYFLNVMFFS